MWVNGDNFATGRQADAWLCGWSADLPNMRFTDPADPLLDEDFGVPVQGCEAPWHKAQFTLVYDSARVPTTPPWPGSWTGPRPTPAVRLPAPPDFTGSVFVRQVLYSVSGGYAEVPAATTRPPTTVSPRPCGSD